MTTRSSASIPFAKALENQARRQVGTEEDVRVEWDLGNAVRKKRHEDEKRQEGKERNRQQAKIKGEKLPTTQKSFTPIGMVTTVKSLVILLLYLGKDDDSFHFIHISDPKVMIESTQMKDLRHPD
ncbi:hypothetical protein DUI87_24904 [Hirundo rustica rustica]|uniref:Uncharacterized protein n=1 Tax=Hirundo rustica rustica TaxID=333673 RepID=A0A3M0JUT4_HIRRU|nr:hypothetical protein DUI87_24904 [Hirundo rustica rustica]